MKLFTCDNHAGHWPVGAASIVIAESETDARYLLDEELLSRSLDPGNPPYTLKEVDMTKPQAIVLDDGDY